MAIIFRAPMKLAQVADLVISIKEGFYRNDKQVKNFSTSPVFWSADNIDSSDDTIEKLPSVSGSYVKTNYRKLIESRSLNVLRPQAADFCVAINSQVLLTGWTQNWHDHLKTRIVNKTLVQDIVNGQTVPAAVNEYVIGTWEDGCGEGWLDSFANYRNSILREAQLRVEQNVALSAHQLIRGLLS